MNHHKNFNAPPSKQNYCQLIDWINKYHTHTTKLFKTLSQTKIDYLNFKLIWDFFCQQKKCSVEGFMTCGKSSYKEKVFLSQRIKADCLERQVETEIMDSVMGPAVYDSRIRPSGINGTGRTTEFSFHPQQSPVKRKWSVAPSIEWVNSKPRHISDGATFVYVNVFVRSFSAINDVKMVSSGLLISQPSISHHSPGCSFIL